MPSVAPVTSTIFPLAGACDEHDDTCLSMYPRCQRKRIKSLVVLCNNRLHFGHAWSFSQEWLVDVDITSVANTRNAIDRKPDLADINTALISYLVKFRNTLSEITLHVVSCTRQMWTVAG